MLKIYAIFLLDCDHYICITSIIIYTVQESYCTLYDVAVISLFHVFNLYVHGYDYVIHCLSRPD